jgi:di/tricarboxylate transporter
VERGDRLIAPAGPETVLVGGDVLRFVGNAADVADLHSRRGISPAVSDLLDGFTSQRLAFYEAVIGSSSPLVGRSLKAIGFREHYRAAVIAIHRADQRVEGKLGEVRLRTGDTLLLIADPAFRTRWQGSPDFLLVSRLGSTDPPRSAKALPAAAVGVGVVVVAGVGWLPILEASLVGALLVVGFGVLTPYEARVSVDINVIVVIASSFGLGAALEATGLADQIASGIVDGLSGAGNMAVLLGVVLATVALTELITNNAAAILMFPIAISTAAAVGGDPRAYAIVVALAASASFLTPIGYQTNTMVWGPGGYRFGDYARVGFPLTIVAIGTITLLAPVFWTI